MCMEICNCIFPRNHQPWDEGKRFTATTISVYGGRLNTVSSDVVRGWRHIADTCRLEEAGVSLHMDIISNCIRHREAGTKCRHACAKPRKGARLSWWDYAL
jgi:hypothetical protein